MAQQPMLVELHQRIRQLGAPRRVRADPTAKPLYRRGQLLATLGVGVLGRSCLLLCGHLAFPIPPGGLPGPRIRSRNPADPFYSAMATGEAPSTTGRIGLEEALRQRGSHNAGIPNGSGR